MDKYEQRRAAYKIIPPDYLHMIEGEDHFTLLSAEEVQYVVEYCVKEGFDEDETMNVIRKLEYGRLASLTTNRFFKGELDILDFDAEGEIIWRAS